MGRLANIDSLSLIFNMQWLIPYQPELETFVFGPVRSIRKYFEFYTILPICQKQSLLGLLFTADLPYNLYTARFFTRSSQCPSHKASCWFWTCSTEKHTRIQSQPRGTFTSHSCDWPIYYCSQPESTHFQTILRVSVYSVTHTVWACLKRNRVYLSAVRMRSRGYALTVR